MIDLVARSPSPFETNHDSNRKGDRKAPKQFFLVHLDWLFPCSLISVNEQRRAEIVSNTSRPQQSSLRVVATAHTISPVLSITASVFLQRHVEARHTLATLTTLGHGPCSDNRCEDAHIYANKRLVDDNGEHQPCSSTLPFSAVRDDSLRSHDGATALTLFRSQRFRHTLRPEKRLRKFLQESLAVGVAGSSVLLHGVVVLHTVCRRCSRP